MKPSHSLDTAINLELDEDNMKPAEATMAPRQ